MKRRLALRFRDDRRAYVDAKGSLLWEIIRKADQSAQAQGWLPAPATPELQDCAALSKPDVAAVR